MTTAPLQALEVHGEPPELKGSACEGLICEAFVHQGVVEASANVAFLKVRGKWHRLAIDFPGLFWRQMEDEPRSWRVVEEGWEYPHSDIAARHSFYGLEFTGLQVEGWASGCQVSVAFSGGRVFRLINRGDRTSYDVI